MVVLVGLNASLGVLDVKIKLVQFLQHSFVHRNSVIANNDSTIKRNI